jgi:uncharacterized membrane protein
MFWLAAVSAVVAAATGFAQTRDTVRKTIWDEVYTTSKPTEDIALQQRCAACHAAGRGPAGDILLA